jgi:putative ABC transport system permease protein
MIEDLRYAFRQLRQHLGFATIAVVTLGLGIGAAAAMFGLIQGVLLSPPPYAAPDRLVLVSPARTDGQPYAQGVTIGQWLAWRNGSKSVAPPALYSWSFNFLVLADGSESLGGMMVTRNYFQVMGLKPMLGRELSESDAARPNVPSTGIILGYDLWKRRYNSDPKILGTGIRISRFPAPLTVVGVMPPGVRFLPDPVNANEPNYDVNATVDFWMAYTPDETQLKRGGFNAVSRLRDGISVPQAQAEIAGITSSYSSTDPDLAGLTGSVRPLVDELNADGRRLLLPLFGAVALLFVIACGNVGGLLLARGLQRQQEYAMRSALGAGRWRLFRQVLTESVALAFVGAVAGAGIAIGLVALLKAIAGNAVPRIDAVTVGWPVFAFGFVAALLASVLAGVLPAVRASSSELQGLEGTRTSASRAERRLLSAVATLQIVLTVALLAGAALLVRTAHNLSTLRPGYDTQQILTMTVTSVGSRESWLDFHTRALERVATIAGVSKAAFVWGLPLTGNKWSGDMEIVGDASTTTLTEKLKLPLRAVTPDYFATMGMSLVDGRGFTSADQEKAPAVAIVNATLARRHFNGAALGRRLRFAGDTSGRTAEIVGIIADTRTDALSEQAEPEIYFSFWQRRAFSKHLILRATGEPEALAARVRQELRALEPTAAVEHIKTMETIRGESVAPRTFAMQLLAGFSVAAMVLALVGLYGLLSLSVGSRTKEIAVRKAIGAQRHEILGLVLGEGFTLIGIGVVLGTIVALLLGPVLSSLLFDVRPTDPATLAASAVLFAIVALGACLIPALRAARVDLMEALRHE